jgi:hypothetical protein
MIHNDRELESTQERIRQFENLLAAARVVEPPANYRAMAEGYLSEIASMQNEIREYLRTPEPVQAA